MVTNTSRKRPWILARSAQAAIGAAAVADVFRAAAVRDRDLHADAPAHTSGSASQVFACLMALAIVLFLVWLARSRRNAQELSPAGPPGRVDCFAVAGAPRRWPGTARPDGRARHGMALHALARNGTALHCTALHCLMVRHGAPA
ncbi:hypothetical protein ACFYY2_30875 [Streptomyces sp. NPDC001822]|uniref:hypothetical protein n=1 Tax=Streptomyces sp. NPDC001822 TaxID=3364614 RepID=UPI0036B2D652